MQVDELRACLGRDVDVGFLLQENGYDEREREGVALGVPHTLIKVWAVLNCPVRKKWRVMVLSSAATASGDENSGSYVGSGAANF